MKRRILALLLMVLMLVSLVPVAASAESLGDVVFTVKANKEAGLDGDVAVSFTRQSNGNYTGTLYLPGSADTSKLFFSWDDGVSVADFASGEAPIAVAGQSVSYTVSFGGNTATFNVETVQGAVGVRGMFVNVDESLGTINAMNGDRDHETQCFGSFTLDGKDYFMSMKGRGNTTWSDFTKKPYNITTYKKADYADKKKTELINGVESKKWSVLANAKDPTCLRNKIGYDVAVALGIGLPSESVDIWMNGEYLGNYLLTPKNDYQTPKYGYLMEIDNKSDVDQFNYNGIMFTLKDVGENETTGEDLTLKEVQPTVQAAVNALNKSDDSYLDYFDLDSWAKMYLLNELYKDVDISAGSIFFSKESLTSGKLSAGPIWDLDGTLGRKGSSWVSVDRNYENTASGWYIDSISGTAFFKLLGNHESFMKRVYEIYAENKDALESILDDLDTQSALIADSAKMDYIRWPQYKGEEHFKLTKATTFGKDAYAVNYVATNTWEDYVTNLKEFVTKRLAFFADNLIAAAPTGSISGKTYLSAGDTLSLTANVDKAGIVSYQWQSSADGETWADIAGATNKTYSASMTAELNGVQFRCVVSNAVIINTSRVAKAPIAATEAVFGPVTAELHEHNYVASSVTEPTCGAQGYTTYTCECGDSYQDDFVPATGDHHYVDVVTPATHAAGGYTTHTCECGDTYIDSETPAIGHNYVAKVTEPTCTAGGYTTYTCECGDSYTADRTSALGHDYQNGRCTRCGATDPSHNTGTNIINSIVKSITNTITTIVTNIRTTVTNVVSRLFSFGR